MAFNIDEFFSSYNASRATPLSDDDPMRMVAAILEALIGEALASFGASGLTDLAGEIRSLRTAMVTETRNLYAGETNLKREMVELKAKVAAVEKLLAEKPKRKSWLFD